MPTDPGRQGGQTPRNAGSRPPAPGPGRRAPMTRQERREAMRRGATGTKLAAAGSAPSKPAWQSPMLLMTLGAIAVGLVIVIIASGVLSPKATVNGLKQPIQTTPAALVDPTNPRALGSAGAKVTVEIWSDFQCPACQFFDTNTEYDFINQYVATGKARFVYRDYAFIDGGAAAGESHQAAAAARCAADQGQFWPYHDYLFENQGAENKGTFTAAFLGQIADAIKLDRGTFDSCMANGAATKVAAVVAETQQGAALQVSQTPTLTVNGVPQYLPNQAKPGGSVSLAQLGQAVDAALGIAASPSPAASAAPGDSGSPGASAAASPTPAATPGASATP